MMRPLLVFLLIFCLHWANAQQPEVVLTTGHTDMINCMSFSPDGKVLATGGLDKNIKLWDVRTTREKRTLSGNDGRIVEVKFDRNGKWIAGLNYNNQLKVWDPVTGKSLATFNEVMVTAEDFDFCMDHTAILYVNNDQEFVIADPATGNEKKRFKTDEYPHRFLVSQDGKSVFALNHLGALIAIDLTSGQVVRKKQLFREFLFSPTRMDIDPSGDFLACSFDDQTIRIYRTSDFSEVQILKGHSNRIIDFRFSQKGDFIYSADHEKNLFKWDFKKGKKLKSYEKTVMGVKAISCHPTEDILAFSEYKVVHLVEPESGNELKQFKAIGNQILSMSYDQQGTFLATAASDISIKLWNLSTLKIERKLDGFFPVEFSPDGKKVVCMGNTIKLWVYDPYTGERLKELDTEFELIQNLEFSPDGKYLAGAGFNGILKIWDLESGKMKFRLTGHSGGIYASSFSPDGTRIVSCGLDNTIKVWDLAKGKEIASMTGHEVLVNDVEYSPDGSLIASASWDKTIRLWDAKTFVMKKELKGHENIVTTLTFTADGKQLITGAGNNVVAPADNSIRIWDVASGTPICKFDNPTGQINKVVMEKKGNLLFSSGEDGMVRIWDIKKCDPVASLICSNLTDYIIVTPDHYYTASRDALAAVSFRVDDRLFPFEQFDVRLNRPDIIASRIGKTPSNLVNAFQYVYQKRLKRMNFKEEDLGIQFHAPQLDIRKSEIPLVTKENLVRFKVKMRDEKFPIDRLQVMVNGVPLYGIQGYDLRSSNSGSIDIEVTADLLAGNNQIKVSCYNTQGAESLIEEFSILRETPLVKYDLYVVCIGVSDYKDNRFDLQYAAKDASDVMNRLTSNKEEYVSIHKKLLVNADVTKENLLAVTEFLQPSGPEDLVVVFIAGHGVLDLNFEYFYGTYDINFDDPAARGITYTQIEDLFSRIKSQRKLLIMDTCHSGELDKDEIESGNKAEVELDDVKFRAVGQGVRQKETFGVSNTFEMMQLLFADVKDETGAVVISSSGGAEYSMESGQWKNGLFTYCLLSAASDFKADLNYDKHMSVSELRKYTYEKVMQLSQGRQKPTTRSENLVLDFLVW